MPNVSELPSGTVKISRAKDAEVAQAKRYAVKLLRLLFSGHTDISTAGVLAGANPLVSSMRNTVNPLPRLRKEAGVPARGAVGVAGKGNWRKRMPPCNGVDRRCNITLPRKRAHFQSVVRDERARRTASGGDRK
jgi:hypothetical protein